MIRICCKKQKKRAGTYNYKNPYFLQYPLHIMFQLIILMHAYTQSVLLFLMSDSCSEIKPRKKQIIPVVIPNMDPILTPLPCRMMGSPQSTPARKDTSDIGRKIR